MLIVKIENNEFISIKVVNSHKPKREGDLWIIQKPLSERLYMVEETIC